MRLRLLYTGMAASAIIAGLAANRGYTGFAIFMTLCFTHLSRLIGIEMTR